MWTYPAQCAWCTCFCFMIVLNSCNDITGSKHGKHQEQIRQNACGTYCVGSSKSMTMSKMTKSTWSHFSFRIIDTPLTARTACKENCFWKLLKCCFRFLSYFENSRLQIKFWSGLKALGKIKSKWKLSKMLFAICNPYPLGKCAYATVK